MSAVGVSSVGGSKPHRVGRRRKLAAALRQMMGGSCALPSPGDESDVVGRRLLDLAGEQRVAPRDSDQAELLARLRLDDRMPSDVVAAICAALLPVLTDTETVPAAAGAAGPGAAS